MANPEFEPPFIEDYPDDYPDGVTESIHGFANGVWDKKMLPELQHDMEWLEHVKGTGNVAYYERELDRLNKKWPRIKPPCQKQNPPKRKPRNYTDFDIDEGE